MATKDSTLKDFLPIPDNVDAVVDPHKKEVAQSLDESPTSSHALATSPVDPAERGSAQLAHGNVDVKDLGWQDSAAQIANPLIGGLPNEELWVLIRRFNKQMYHVKDYPYPVMGKLDLQIADEEEFSPDKLRANLERLYMTVAIGLMGFAKHIMRLRSWQETKRTGAFCAAYFVAWIFDLIVPLFLLTMIVLITYPPSRSILFPPAPLALVSAKTGGLQKPKAGVLGSKDSATGAPENYKGEAVEAEASNFVNNIASVALSSASGKHPQSESSMAQDKGEKPSDKIPDPTEMAINASGARMTAKGDKSHHDKSKVPMETAMWNKMRPIMHGIADVSDTWERFGNVLSPTSPFPRDVYRLRLATLIVPLLAASFFITSYMVTKGMTFGIGFGFFGDPVIQPGIKWLNTNFPNWPKLLELRNTLLKGIPTNAQLTITLLRIGEANKAPLPPPPHSGGPPPDEAVHLKEGDLGSTGTDVPLAASQGELRDAMKPEPHVASESTGSDIDASKKKDHSSAGSKMLSVIKGGVKGTVGTVLGADRLKAKAGSEPSKQRLGVIPRSKEIEPSGPIDFKCRYHGRRGHLYISVRATIPCASFSLDNVVDKEGTLSNENQLHPVWSVAIADIKELKKVGGLGWKTKLVVGWAMGREVADGLEVVDKLGNHWVVTAMVLRDELFNRLVAMGGQKWEAW